MIINFNPSEKKINIAKRIIISIDDDEPITENLYQMIDNVPIDIPRKAQELFKIGWEKGLDAGIVSTKELVDMGWNEVRSKFKKIDGYWFERPNSILLTASLHKIEHHMLNTASKDGSKILKLLKVPIARVGINGNGLMFTEEVLKSMEQSWNDLPVQGDYMMKSNDHTLNDTKSDILSYGTVGWTSNPRFDGDTQYVDITVTEPTTIEKLLRRTPDGKRELNGVSMGAYTYDVCSVCSSPMGECEHVIGKDYGGLICHAIAVDGFGHHVAFTNNPAEDAWLDDVKEQIM